MEHPPSKFQLKTPAGYNTIEGWLSVQDSQPRCIPNWPGSRRMCLVACVVEGFGREDEVAEATAYVLTARSQADRLVNFCGASFPGGVLFFRIPRMTVLAPEVCPEGLTADCWEVESDEAGA